MSPEAEGFGLPPAFDPACQAFLDAAPGMPELTPETIAALRRRPPIDLAGFEAAHDVTLSTATAPGIDGHPGVPLLIATPNKISSGQVLPLLYVIHGGGMVLGHVTEGLTIASLLLAPHFNAAVVSVDYRLAPENRHPAPMLDCVAGAQWCLQRAASLGSSPERLVLVGASAGGGLGAGAALYMRDHDLPSVVGQMLLFPMLDDRNNSVSARQLAGLGIWDQTANAVGWAALLGEAFGTDDVPCYAAPARATSLAGLPPAYLDAGSNETFRDEVGAYAYAIWRDGGTAELHVWPGGVHGHSGYVPDSSLARAEWAARRSWLNRLLDEG